MVLEILRFLDGTSAGQFRKYIVERREPDFARVLTPAIYRHLARL
ncbi:MAG: hypothetical protein ACYDDI_08010 [Candidatus Acidiferrales bacterium]